jgi:hypothetical protein
MTSWIRKRPIAPRWSAAARQHRKDGFTSAARSAAPQMESCPFHLRRIFILLSHRTCWHLHFATHELYEGEQDLQRPVP